MKKQFAIFLLCLPFMGYSGSVRAEEICSYAPSQSYVINRITSGLSGVGTGALLVMQSAGLSIAADGGGAYALAGAGGAIAGSSMAIPALIVAGVAAVSAGMALELGCIRENHPGAVREVGEFAERFHRGALAVIR